VDELAPLLTPFDAPTLIHGDLTFENVLWNPDQHRIEALLDFEWSRLAPQDLDLDVLLRFVAFPQLHVPADYEHLAGPEEYADVPRWLAESYPELFAGPRLFDRLRLYAISWDVQEVLDHPPKVPTAQLHPLHPWHRLRANLEGTSHLHTFEEHRRAGLAGAQPG
jgi:hygromycin-B 7''-O-kinase